jgi:pimeloyl-ACP methyl ester carboxylesterase
MTVSESASTHVLVERDGVTIEVLEQGSGPIVVILPSLGRGASDYAELANLLDQEGFRSLLPQPRGVGGSHGPMTGLTMHDLANDVATVIEARAKGRVVVAGHAFGNFVARMVATLRPDLVRGIALLAASAGRIPSGESPYEPDVLASIFASSDSSLPAAERRQHLQRAFFAPGNDPAIWLTGWYPEAKLAQRAADKATPIEAYFHAGSAPILDLQAADDTVAPRKFAHVLRDALGPRVTVRVVANAGHALIPEQPQEVSKALAEWMRHIPAG